MGAWKVTAGDVDLIGAGFWQAAEGRQSLDLEGGVAGTIERSFDTAIGVCYAVDYAVAGNVDGPPATKTGYARVTQGLLSLPLRPLRRDFSFDTTGRTRADMGYVRKSLHFRSLASKATLTFAGTTGSGYGPVIDDVSVSATLLSHCHRS
jgi:choice-of-anchor C domain-containing protein